MSYTPHKFQVSWLNYEDEEWKDFSSLDEAEEFMTTLGGADLMVFTENGDHIELHNGHWFLVDNEPLDDGYDYDRYY